MKRVRRAWQGLGVRTAVAVATALSLLGVGALWPAAAAAHARARVADGGRVSVGLFGDSVTESVVIPHFQTQGLAPQLAAAETHYGFTPGGEGLIAANQYDWTFNRYGILGINAIPLFGWGLVGGQDASFTEPGTDGPSGYSAITQSLLATATTTVSDPIIQVLYTTSQLPCSFTVTAAGQSWTIDTFRQSIEPEAAEYPINLGSGTHTLTVHGSTCGGLIFDGVIAQRPLTPGRTQIQVDNDGHAARQPNTDLSTRVEEGILAQHYKVSVFLYGYIGELTVARGASARTYEQALLTRARLARMNDGTCLIAAPTPMPVSRGEVALVAGLERSVARRAGCTYTTALTHLWPNPTAGINRGLVVIDGIHPSAAGYRLMAAALAPIVARLARS